MERPEIVTDEHLEFLDGLRASGVTNMYGAGPYVRDEFGVNRDDAKTIVLYWMSSFSARHSDPQPSPDTPGERL